MTSDGRQPCVLKRRIINKILAIRSAMKNVAVADRLIAPSIQAECLDDQCSVTKPLSETDRLILTRTLDIKQAKGVHAPPMI